MAVTGDGQSSISCAMSWKVTFIGATTISEIHRIYIGYSHSYYRSNLLILLDPGSGHRIHRDRHEDGSSVTLTPLDLNQ